MSWKKEYNSLLWLTAGLLVCFFLPVGQERFDTAVIESLYLVRWYAREHVLLCLMPAFFIAGAVAVFVSKESVMKYLGAGAPKVVAYCVASVSGTILAVCSCTILPLFAGIYRMGAGLGPACAFLYSGPAINILAIILTARILGWQLGVARAVGAIVFSVVIGLLMHLIFRKEEQIKAQAQANVPHAEPSRPLHQTIVFFAAMIGILVFANWGAPPKGTLSGVWFEVWSLKWTVTACFSAALAIILARWFELGWRRILPVVVAVAVAAFVAANVHTVGTVFGLELQNIEPAFVSLVPFVVGIVGLSIIASTGNEESAEWFDQSWFFAKQILPLLLAGVLVAGLLLGRPEIMGGKEGFIPSEWVASLVGGNSLWANFVASFAGAFMYFATLTEVPILQGLLARGMGHGPALALLLAGPALSLPNMLVIHSVMGTKKTIVFISLVIIMATISGYVFGCCFNVPISVIQ